MHKESQRRVHAYASIMHIGMYPPLPPFLHYTMP